MYRPNGDYSYYTHQVHDVGESLRPRQRERVGRAEPIHAPPHHGVQVSTITLVVPHRHPQSQAEQDRQRRPQVLEGHEGLLGQGSVCRVGRLVCWHVRRDPQPRQQLLPTKKRGSSEVIGRFSWRGRRGSSEEDLGFRRWVMGEHGNPLRSRGVMRDHGDSSRLPNQSRALRFEDRSWEIMEIN